MIKRTGSGVRLTIYVTLDKLFKFFPLNNSEVKVIQLCATLCDSMDYTVHGILQAKILEWVAFPFSRGSSQPKDRTALQADSLPAEPQSNSVICSKSPITLFFFSQL